MSMMAGIWHFDNKPIDPVVVRRWEQTLIQHGPDGRGEFQNPESDALVMLHRAFWMTREDQKERQPVAGRSCGGMAPPVLTWDGRLDNREELLRDIHFDLPTPIGDAAIALGAWELWGPDSFRRLKGDWAVAIWDPRARRVVLARDYVGTRNLYYSNQPDRFLWCSHIDTLVLHASLDLTLSDGFVANYLLSSVGHPTLTPYEAIQAVPPGGWMEVTPRTLRLHRSDIFRDWHPLRYKTDGEYEEHFRYALRQAVKRRMRTAYPLLVDLSGGLDSSSVVCIAYDLLERGESTAEINTLSYYSLEEPGGDERSFIELIERHIGKAGTHIEVKTGGRPLEPIPLPHFCGWPGYFARALEAHQELQDRLGAQGNRGHLTGLGGDEVTGGVPDPTHQLASFLLHFELAAFVRSVCHWSIARKRTVWQTVAETGATLLPEWLRATGRALRNDRSWVKGWVRVYGAVNLARPVFDVWQPVLTGVLPPSLIGHSLARILTGRRPPLIGTTTALYPYLDQDLVSFLNAVPSEQLLQPGKRRHLMRRALIDLVPEPVLWRKTKWIGRRQLLLHVANSQKTLESQLHNSALSRYVDVKNLRSEHSRCLDDGSSLPTLLLEHLLGLEALLYQLSVASECASIHTMPADLGHHVRSQSGKKGGDLQ